MKTRIELVPNGSVTSPQGFRAGATYAGIKTKTPSSFDLGIILSQQPCTAAALFTRNNIKAAPVIYSRECLKSGKVQAVVANSGCANACTGDAGLDDARETARLAGTNFNLPPESILLASTGIIGQRLPMEAIRTGLGQLAATPDGGRHFAQAIMTTDKFSKEAAVTIKTRDHVLTIGGAAKGSGMIHPNMGTLLCFLTTDAAVESEFLHWALKQAIDVSLNMVTVDGDTSTNDMALVMANGSSDNSPIVEDSELAIPFKEALEQICVYLAKSIAGDGEGASRLIQVTVSSAASTDDARIIARTIAGSSLVKTAVHGGDPNWGRIIAAAGRAGPVINEEKLTLFLGNVCVFRKGKLQNFNREKAVAELMRKEVNIELQMDSGSSEATAWGCDLSKEYVEINAEYST